VPVGYKFDEKAPPAPPRANDWERRILKIDQVRLVQHDVSRAPFEGRWRVVILRRFEEANEEAANAFLKTLEEPPSHTRLILTARDTSLLLPTIASRCQVLALRPLAPGLVERTLIEKSVDAERARLLAHLSGGRIGWALRTAQNPALLDTRNECLDVLTAVVQEGRAERLTRADALAKKSDDLPELLDFWLGWWRDVLLMQTGEGTRVTNVDRANILQEHATRFSFEQVNRAVKSVRGTARYLAQNVNARLAIEVLLLNLPGVGA
jgi:DNA polymerase-3 subunit delta'